MLIVMVLAIINIHLSTQWHTTQCSLQRFAALKMLGFVRSSILAVHEILKSTVYFHLLLLKKHKVSYFLQVCALTSVHNHTYDGSLLLLHINFMYIPLNIALKVKIIDGVHRASETLFLERLFVLVTKALLGFAISFFVILWAAWMKCHSSQFHWVDKRSLSSRNLKTSIKNKTTCTPWYH